MRWRWAVVIVLGTEAGATSFLACVGDDPSLSAAPAPPADGGGAIDQASSDAPAGGDAATDAGPRCRREDPFGTATLLAGLNSGIQSVHPRLTTDELEIFFQRQGTIYTARRGSRDLPFETPKPVPLEDPDAAVMGADPAISGNSLALYFGSATALARMTRPARTAPFGSVELLGLTPDGSIDQDPHVLGDESALYFARATDGGGRRIWRAAGDGDGGFLQPEEVLFGTRDHHNPSVSDDELEIYVAIGVAGVERASRASIADAFGALVPADDLNAPKYGGGGTRPGWISPDGCRIYFASGTVSQIYVAERTPR